MRRVQDDDVIKTFLQTDPIGYGDGMNMYADAGGDPINFSDPSGLARGFADDDPTEIHPTDIIRVTGTRRNWQDNLSQWASFQALVRDINRRGGLQVTLFESGGGGANGKVGKKDDNDNTEEVDQIEQKLRPCDAVKGPHYACGPNGEIVFSQCWAARVVTGQSQLPTICRNAFIDIGIIGFASAGGAVSFATGGSAIFLYNGGFAFGAADVYLNSVSGVAETAWCQ